MAFERLSATAAVLALVLVSCTTKTDDQSDPKRRLDEYISESFAIHGPGDRTQLLSYLTGEAKARLDSWSDDQFREAFMEAKRQFIKLAFKEIKPVSGNEVNITYELTYDTKHADAQGKAHSAKITNRKLADMVRKDGQWYIAEVRSLKELVEYKDEMLLP